MQRIRRLVIAEAARFPDLGRAYYEGSFEFVLQRVADALARAAQQGRLRIEDPMVAANHLAGLVLWLPVNRIMMTGRLDSGSAQELDAAVTAGAAAFLAAYGPDRA